MGAKIDLQSSQHHLSPIQHHDTTVYHHACIGIPTHRHVCARGPCSLQDASPTKRSNSIAVSSVRISAATVDYRLSSYLKKRTMCAVAFLASKGPTGLPHFRSVGRTRGTERFWLVSARCPIRDISDHDQPTRHNITTMSRWSFPSSRKCES